MGTARVRIPASWGTGGGRWLDAPVGPEGRPRLFVAAVEGEEGAETCHPFASEAARDAWAEGLELSAAWWNAEDAVETMSTMEYGDAAVDVNIIFFFDESEECRL